MKRFSIQLAVVLLVTVWNAVAAAGEYAPRNKPRPPLGNNPNPVIWGGKQDKAPPQPPPQTTDRHARPDRSHHGHRRAGCGFRAYDPYAYSYVYTPFYNYVYAKDFFGPQAGQRFPGMGNLEQPIDAAADADAPAPAPKKTLRRATNPQANALAWRFIGFGDAQFARENYIEANDRYRKAARSAPQLADAWFRQAFALSAMGRCRQAVAAVQRGLGIEPDWPRSDFRLEELFDGDEAAKKAYLDALTTAAQKNPLDADLLFIRGAAIHFDKQSDEAQICFKRSLQLAGQCDEHIRAFLAK